MGDDYKSITFELRKGHKWSDGEPFTADDVVFFFEDIIQNKELNPETTTEWGVNVHAKAIDETHVEVSFDEPFPGFLTYMATSGSYFSTFAPRHFFEKFMPQVQSERQRGRQGGRVRGLDQVVHQLLPEVA